MFSSAIEVKLLLGTYVNFGLSQPLAMPEEVIDRFFGLAVEAVLLYTQGFDLFHGPNTTSPPSVCFSA